DRVNDWSSGHQADALSPSPDSLEYAIFYHDAVYDPGRNDNEQRSADLAARELTRLGLAKEYTTGVAELVLETAHLASTSTSDPERPPPGRTDGSHAGGEALALMHDIDLAIFAAPLDRVIEYDRQIRVEYSAIERETFRGRRGAILRDFLDRPAIYRTAVFQDRCERAARMNIAALLRRFYSGERSRLY
ncbi:MAG: hypothetical protein ACOC1I_03060, partial [Spirochaetota bacterium]